MRGPGRWILIVTMLAGAAAPCHAQTGEPRFEVAVGGLFSGGYALTDPDATLTRNQSGGGRFTLFESASRMEGGPGFEARAGWRLTRVFALEGGVALIRPRLSTRLTGDVEGGSEITIENRFSTYVFDGAIVAHLRGLGFAGGRGVPFLRAGVGYLRELYEDNVLVETGRAYHAGGGVTLWFGDRRRIALRADGRVYVFDGGADLDTGTRVAPAGGASLVLAF